MVIGIPSSISDKFAEENLLHIFKEIVVDVSGTNRPATGLKRKARHFGMYDYSQDEKGPWKP